MALTLSGFRSLLRLDLKDSGALWSNTELDRAVQRAVDDLSRHLPWEKVHEERLSFTVTGETVVLPATTNLTAVVNAQSIDVPAGSLLTISGQPDVPRPLIITITDADNSTYGATFIIRGVDSDSVYQEEILNYARGYSKTLTGKKEFKYVYEVELDQDYGSHAGDTASVGYGLFTNAWVYLSNRPIRPETETTSSPAGTTYTRNTHYTMDYINGRIKPISVAGGMSAGGTYLIGYTKSRLGINIANLIPVITRVTRVECPVDYVPQQFVTFNIFGDFMYVASKVAGKSQEELSDGEHIAIYYERRQMPPGEFSPGSYPDVLDDVLVIGAAGYALLMAAQQYEQAAATALASMNSALTNLIKYLNNNSSVDLAGKLALVTATIRTTITDAAVAASGYLASVGVTDLDKASVGATAWLTKGELLINAVPIGSNVAENYANYAAAKVGIANARVTAAIGNIQEANVRLDHLRSYIEEANGYRDLAQGFLAESQQRAEIVNGNLVLSDKFRAEGLQRLTEFQGLLKDKAEYRKRVSSAPVRQPA